MVLEKSATFLYIQSQFTDFYSLGISNYENQLWFSDTCKHILLLGCILVDIVAIVSIYFILLIIIIIVKSVWRVRLQN